MDLNPSHTSAPTTATTDYHKSTSNLFQLDDFALTNSSYEKDATNQLFKIIYSSD